MNVRSRVPINASNMACSVTGPHLARGFCAVHYHISRLGLTPDEYVEKLRVQGGACTLCDREFSDSVLPELDHCHKFGAPLTKVAPAFQKASMRDFLCGDCNRLLGRIEKDNHRFLKRATRYLETWDAAEAKAYDEFQLTLIEGMLEKTNISAEEPGSAASNRAAGGGEETPTVGSLAAAEALASIGPDPDE